MTAHPRIPVWDSVPKAERVKWIKHIDSCALCRNKWLDEEPSRVFCLLADSPIDETELEDLSSRVLEEIEGDKRDHGSLARVTVVIAASFLLAALTVPFMVTPGPIGPSVDDQVTSTVPNSISPYQPAATEVEILATPGFSRVVDMTVGETKVVMIFDERLEI